MSDYSGVFDQLANALRAADASPSTTLRANRPPRRHPLTQTFASRPVPRPPTPLDPIIDPIITPLVTQAYVAPKAPRRIDRSRDHAVYAAPHRPSRPHYHSRPDDVVTERVFRRALETASKASRSLPVVTIAFAATVAVGLACLILFTWH